VSPEQILELRGVRKLPPAPAPFETRAPQPDGSDEPSFAHDESNPPPIGEDVEAKPTAKLLLWYGDTPPKPSSYLVDETVPEIGVVILGGQWGAAKTFVGADLVSAVIVGGEFAGKTVNRKGGVLWLAAEGENEIEARVYAAINARGGDPDEKQPFARQAVSVPCLTDKDALERLRAMANEAAAHMREHFDCDLVAIFIDTLAAAAGFDDENSASETQKVMNIAAALAREAKTPVVVLDHYGKVADTGIRGSSAKSSAADAILACLGDRDQDTGATTNRRMAVTKLRSGPTGRIINFRLPKLTMARPVPLSGRTSPRSLSSQRASRCRNRSGHSSARLTRRSAPSARRRFRALACQK
jgi:AAA domain